MVTEKQQRLAHRIAATGIWPYTDVIDLMENQSNFVQHLKDVLREFDDPFGADHLERAYIFARWAVENRSANFSQAFVCYARQAYVPAFKQKIIEWVAGEKISAEYMEQARALCSEYMQRRYEMCMKNDPFYSEWLEKQEEQKIVVAFLSQSKDGINDYKTFKNQYQEAHNGK